MYLLDTNVVSVFDPRRQAYTPELVAWLDSNSQSTFMSVVSIMEVETGILKLRRQRKSKRASELSGLLATMVEAFRERLLPVDLETAMEASKLGESTFRQPVELPDLLIAATANRHGLILLTHNTAEFSRLSIPMLDPFTQLPPDA